LRHEDLDLAHEIPRDARTLRLLLVVLVVLVVLVSCVGAGKL